MFHSYETEETITSERDVAEIIGKKLSMDIIKLHKYCPVDYAGVSHTGEILAWIEIKTRSYSSDRIQKMGGYMISLSKIMRAHELVQFSGAPFYLVVGLYDGIFYKKMHDRGFTPLRLAMGGKKDKNDSTEWEPCLYYDLLSFNQIEHGEFK